jgi:hypothetical protein
MGRLVKLWKSQETDESVEYRYGPERGSTGRLIITKSTGIVTLPEAVPGMSPQESWFLYGMLAKAKAEKMRREDDYTDEASMAT